MKLEIVELILRAVVLFMAGFVIPAFREWLKTRTENEQMEKVRTWVYSAVYAAEQIYNHAKQMDPGGDLRKKYVHNTVMRICANSGIKISEDELDTLIEAAVSTLNSIHAAETPAEGGPEDDSSKEDT